MLSFQAFTSKASYFDLVKPDYPQCAYLLVISTILAFMTSASNHRVLWIILQIFTTSFKILYQYKKNLADHTVLLTI